MPVEKRIKLGLNDQIQIAMLIISLIGIAVGAYFSIRSEKASDLTITYISKRPLVSIEEPRKNVIIEVILKGKLIAKPWLLSGRLENTGNKPIEGKDIELPVKLTFNVPIVGAYIIERSRPDIYLSAIINGNEVTLENKLLNQGDWVGFDILFDGEPEIPPKLSLRISDVAQPKQRIIFSGAKRPYLSALTLPLTAIYSLLIMASIVPVGWILFGIFTFRESFTKPLPLPFGFVKMMRPGDLDRKKIIKELEPKSKPAKIAFSFLDSRIEYAMLDQPDVIKNDISSKVPIQVFETFGMTAYEVAVVLCSELKICLKKQLENRLEHWLPRILRRAGVKEFGEINATASSVQEIFGTCEAILQSAEKNVQQEEVSSRVKVRSLIFSILILLSGFSALFVLAGTWRNLLGI